MTSFPVIKCALKWVLVTTLGVSVGNVQAELNIFATVPEWGALAQVLGSDKVKVFVATTATQDPHRIQARPSLIARARNAQLVIATGAELEVGWLPILQRESGNPAIQVGQPGFFEAANVVQLTDIPQSLDRSMGDVHAQGNPHIQTDPRNLIPIAQALTKRMEALDPDNQEHYAQQLNKFLVEWQTNLQNWTREAKPLQGARVWVQHDGFPYLLNWLELKRVGTLEPRPGVEPSVAYLSEVLVKQKQLAGQIILTAAYQNDSPSKWFSEKTGLPFVVLPFTVGADAETKTLAAVYTVTISRLLKSLQLGQ